MTTTVTLTGTGVPMPNPGRAGAGTLVRYDDVNVQVDAGRSTLMRLADIGVGVHQLAAVLLTHLHSDHITGLADLVLTRWVQDDLHHTGGLGLVAPAGRAEVFVRRLLDAYAYDIDVRTSHLKGSGPEVIGHWFPLPGKPAPVWRSGCGRVQVDAVRVHHEPVEEAVGYRITTPDGVVAVSGDTRVCDEIADLATGADVLVHEACRSTALAEVVRGTRFETIFSYHADTVALGALAQRIGLPHLVLTHLIPAPTTAQEEQGFIDDVRQGGYEGRVTVGRDLTTIEIGAQVGAGDE
ncbi:MBL fold metallo-hydrolase [Streptomyces olivaceus]